MSVSVSIDSASPVPPFEQIRVQITGLIETGTLVDGERLPSVRQLAGDLRVAPGTVARAYKEMEETGLLVSRRGAGTRVAPRSTMPIRERADLLRDAVEDALSRARALGFSDADIARAVDRALARPRPSESRRSPRT
ncbi:GntR family transcriptional regulator [Actinomyces gerencseriae]|jgi:putative regulator|uniref:GntR family transcriptional regulator n=1 Tax=Actinomyces gerencseriae TaxID=52769 RepID=UPI00042723F4|nr:GntR family transcriptional regulator [Actinomyces gerencseriae]